MWVWSWGQEDPLEEEAATHSSVLAWRIPWTEEPGRLQSIGLNRVRHDLNKLGFYLLTLSLSFTHTLIWQVVYWVPTTPLALQWWVSQGLWIPNNLLYSHIIAATEKVCVIYSIQIFQLQFWVFRPWRLVLLWCVRGVYFGICLFPFEPGRPTIFIYQGTGRGLRQMCACDSGSGNHPSCDFEDRFLWLQNGKGANFFQSRTPGTTDFLPRLWR